MDYLQDEGYFVVKGMRREDFRDIARFICGISSQRGDGNLKTAFVSVSVEYDSFTTSVEGEEGKQQRLLFGDLSSELLCHVLKISDRFTT